MGLPIANTALVLTSSLGGTITITTPPSSKVMVAGSPGYFGPLIGVLSAVNVSGYISVTDPFTIMPTSLKVLSNGMAPIRAGDFVVITVHAVHPSAGPGTFLCTITVATAGQLTVLSE